MTERIQWKLVDHISIPGMILIQGPAFPLAICAQAADITFPDYLRIMANARLIAAAPEMCELIQELSNTWWNDCQFIPSDTEAAWALSNKLARLATSASQLLAKIEGGGDAE